MHGKTVVVTGTLEHFTREQIEEVIFQQGGKAGSSVSKNTDFVVAGSDPGSKLDKAKSLGIPVLSEDDFDRLIGRGGPSAKQAKKGTASQPSLFEE